MESAYLHIVTNHIPIIGVPLALALLVLGIWRKSDELKTASFLVLIFLGAATLGTFLLGQGGEDYVEDLAGISHDSISEHEGFAKFALGSVAVTAILSLFAMFRYKGYSFLKRRGNNPLGDDATSTAATFPNWIVFAILVFTLSSSAILGYTGKLGGKIRHSEFYGGVQTFDGQKEETDKEGRKGRGRERDKD